MISAKESAKSEVCQEAFWSADESGLLQNPLHTPVAQSHAMASKGLQYDEYRTHYLI